MPMKPKVKDPIKKSSVVRQPISDSSLVFIPDDVLDGFQDRIETGIDWTDMEMGARRHRKHCREDLPVSTFSQALQYKIDNSFLKGFYDETDSISLEHHWDLMLPIQMWDTEKFGTREAKLCFRAANNITEDLTQLIKKTVRSGDRQTMKNDIKLVNILRVNDCKMTELDKSLTEFKNLISLNLCGNYLHNIDSTLFPATLRSLELQCNGISNIEQFTEKLSIELFYLGLARNLLTDESIFGISRLPYSIMVLDLSGNDICNLSHLLDVLVRLPSLYSLHLAGNPCAVCAAYSQTTLSKLPRLRYLDSREILPADRPEEPIDIYPDDLRSTYFFFTVFRIISPPIPPKHEKGATTAFYIELEIPLLDSQRRIFLMYRENEFLVEMQPPGEDESFTQQSQAFVNTVPNHKVGDGIGDEATSIESNIYDHIEPKNPRQIRNYTTFESNRVQYNKILNFQEPTVKIFCPDLKALRDTFRSAITVRLVYSVLFAKPTKEKRTSVSTLKAPPQEMFVTLATVRCSLRDPDWSQSSQHFHWDDSLPDNQAIHWGDGDLSVLQYGQPSAKTPKTKQDGLEVLGRQMPPENLTCHFGFGIETLRD